MQTITWLHISDLHTNNSKHGWEYDKITDKLVNDLEKMRENHRLVPDFIFFTGDAAFGLSDNAPEENLAEQYARTHDFLEAIRTRYGNNISKENMFIVPGNHDVNINKHLPGLISWLKEPHSLDDVHDIIHKGGDFWRQFMDKLSDYNEFLKTYGYNHLVEGEGDGVRIPDRGIYCIIRKRHGITMAIVGLNSPWSSAGDGPSECGELRLGGERQLGFLYNTLKKADFAIALMHHPVNWFAPDENPSFEDNLRESFKFFLHGHEHANNVVLNEQYTRIGAGACYEHDTKETGYNFVRLNLHEKTGEIWLREYDKRYGGKWKPCVAGVKTNNDGRRLLKESVAWLGDLHVPSPVSGKRENQASKPELCSYVVIISGKFADTNREEILAFCQHLKRLLSDPLLTLRSFGHGSIVLLLQGEKKGYERLLKMISEGKLRDINGREIQKCYLYQEPDLGVASYPPVSTGALKTNKSQRSIPFDLTQQPAAFPGLYAVQGQFIQDVFLGSQMIVQQAQYPEPIQISQSRYRRETRDEIEERTEITYQIPGSQAFREGVAAIPALGFGGYSMTEPMKGKKSEAISRTFAGMSGRPPIQLFRQLPGASPDMPMVKAGLDTPSLQGGFIPTSMHTKFLDKYDPTQSYCFRTGEKTGKTSWLGYLAQYLISGFDQAYEPVWVNSIPEGYDAYAILTESLTRQKDYFQGRKPILFVDNLHLQPNLIAAIPRLRASKSVWREVPICCTYLSSPPEKGSWRAAWDESKGVWPMAEKFFEERRDVPGHMMVSDKDGKLTEDGKTLLEAVAKNLDQERADLLRPVFEEPQKEVPYAWLAFYVVENFSRGRAEAEQWIYENRVKMAQEKLYQVTWSGSERHQDIIRAAAFLSPTARDLLVQFCSRLRQEPEEQIEEHLDRILDLGDIWDEEEKWPFSHDKVTYFDMQDGLMTLALMPENFSKASQQRYSDILLECVAPGTKAGERAAILARTFTREDREFQNRLCERLANADLSLAGELFLFCMARFVEEFDSAELVNSLAQAMMAKAPPRWRAMWAGALSSVRARLQDLKRDVMVKALYEKVVSTLELDWNEEGDLAEAGVALANFYMDEKSWDQALSWWERIEERIEDHRDAANAKIVQCFLKAGNVAEAEKRSEAMAETVELAIVWAEHFEETADWEKAIAWYRSVGQGSADYQAAALERIGNLYRDKFDPPRVDEAKGAYEESFEADSSRPNPLVGLVTLYEKNKQWELAAEVHKRIGAFETHRNAANAKIVQCFLKAGNVAEAEKRSEAMAETVELAIVWAEHFEKNKQWELAAEVHKRIGAFETHRNAANAKIVQCFLKAGNVAEAEKRSEAMAETVELAIVWAEHFEETANWEKAIAWYRSVGQGSADYQAAALERIGNLYRDKFDPPRVDEAKGAYEESFEADSSRPNPLVGLVTLYEKNKQWELAAEVHKRIGAFETHRNAANANPSLSGQEPKLCIINKLLCLAQPLWHYRFCFY